MFSTKYRSSVGNQSDNFCVPSEDQETLFHEEVFEAAALTSSLPKCSGNQSPTSEYLLKTATNISLTSDIKVPTRPVVVQSQGPVEPLM